MDPLLGNNLCKFCFMLVAFALASGVYAGDEKKASLRLIIQPVQSAEFTKQAYQPLADYLSSEINRKIVIEVADNYLTHWRIVRSSKDADLTLDAAHFTGYRIKKKNYQALAKVQGTVTYSVITNESDLLFTHNELIGKTVGMVPSPSLGGIRLLDLFPNPMRQPKLIVFNNYTQVLDMVRSGKIIGGIVPTALINNDLTVNTVVTTRPVPHMAVSASPGLDNELQQRVRQALIHANESKHGRQLLSKIGLDGFEAASNSQYLSYEKLLTDIWGY